MYFELYLHRAGKAAKVGQLKLRSTKSDVAKPQPRSQFTNFKSHHSKFSSNCQPVLNLNAKLDIVSSNMAPKDIYIAVIGNYSPLLLK